ncbi:extracellular solute-binding protein [Caproiciproducens sp. R1]|jgi:multiple sugar transport system substrate-binding protein|uniref:extracellular solute-binding protein n=1 Tax=Caproiciproducens sp. R1 TaxID=3435000 RepID=UPI000571CB90
MKKFTSCVLAVALAASLLTGCGAPAANSDSSAAGKSGATTTITLWSHIDENWNPAQDKMIADFEAANPDIKVVRESFPYDEFESKTQTSLLSKEGGADVYQLWGGWAIDYAKTGAFSPVPDTYMEKVKADSYEPVIGSFGYNGKYYGVPLEFNIEYGGLLVNTPKFKELGIQYPTTWDDMINIAKKNSSSDGAVYHLRGLDFVGWDTLPYTWLSMILSSGGKYMEGDKFNFNNPVGVETMQKLVDYVAVDKITNLDGLTNASDTEPYQKLFTSDEELMVPRGPWTVSEGIHVDGLEYGKDFEYVAMPFYGSQKLFAAETGWGLAVNASSKNQEAAWKFVEFWTDPDRVLDYNIACGMVPASKTAAHNPELLKAMPYLEPLVNILDGGKFIGYFNTDKLKENVKNTFIDIVNNKTPVAEALEKLDSTMNAEK